MIYIPGVVRVCLAIANNRDDARRLPIKRNSIAAITDGSAVLGLGNLGPEIDPAEAIRYATVVATGRSDFPTRSPTMACPARRRCSVQRRSGRGPTRWKVPCCRVAGRDPCPAGTDW